MGRVCGILTVLVLLVGGLTACDPAAEGADDEWGRLLAGLGIAVVPFSGGAAPYPVDGATVLTVTDWQARMIATGLPEEVDDAGATPSGGAAQGRGHRYAGVPPDILDAIGSTEGDGPTASGVVAAWWRYADSVRGDAARSLLPFREGAIPQAVLLLFLADALGDAGRTVSAAASSQPQAFARGAGPMAAPDACGAVSDAIGSVNAFLDGMGELGGVVRGALEQAYGAIDALTGHVLATVKRAIAIANVVLNLGSLLTSWKVQWKTTPATALQVGLSGITEPMSFADTVRLTGEAAQPPAAVQSCLTLLGIVDPTSQKGTALDWLFHAGYPLEVPTGLIVPGTPPATLDDENAATVALTTGIEALEAKKRSVQLGTGQVVVSMRRADAARVTDYIRSLGGGLVDAVLGGALEQVATAIEVAVNPVYEVREHVVRYWVADETPDPPVAGPPDTPADPPVSPPIDTPIECSVSAERVAAISGETITSARYGEFGDPTSGPVRACLYDVAGGGMIVIGEAIFPDDPAAVDPGFTGILTEGGCNRAAGHLELGSDIYAYLVWSGYALRGTYFFQRQMTDPEGVLPALAREDGMC